MINKKLNRDQWFQLDDQMRRTHTEPGAEDEPGQHFILMALLSKFGYAPNSKWEAMKLADNLVQPQSVVGNSIVPENMIG